MANLFDYVARERATFDEKPFGVLDAAVLTQAVMIDAPGVVPEPACAPGTLARVAALVSPAFEGARFSDIIARADAPGTRLFQGLVPGDIERLLPLLAASPRFCGLRLRDYRSVVDDDAPVQFGAMTFTWRDRFAFVAFRGTDAPLAGWRENCEMCYRDETGAQRLARAYLEEVAGHLPRRIQVGGHSKGGNLALYAALTCADGVRTRIDHLWCLDGQGFKAGRFTAADAAPLADRVTCLVPQDSVVGMLLEHPVSPQAVESHAFGLEQHSVFTWEVAGDDFQRLDRPSDFALGVHDVMTVWLASMDDQEKRDVVQALFAAIEASGAPDAAALLGGGQVSLRLVGEAARQVDEDSREVLNKALGDLAAIAVRRVGADAAQALWSWLQDDASH